jgi:multiple sugar transport system permease protein
MTGGGPGTKTQTLPIYMYQSAFKFYQLGYGAALAIVLLAVGGVFSVIYLRSQPPSPCRGRRRTRRKPGGYG